MNRRCAAQLADLMHQGLRVEKVGESSFGRHCLVRRCWQLNQGPDNTDRYGQFRRTLLTPRVCTVDGVLNWLHQGASNSQKTRLCLAGLEAVCEERVPAFHESSVLLWDNAPYYSSRETQVSPLTINSSCVSEVHRAAGHPRHVLQPVQLGAGTHRAALRSAEAECGQRSAHTPADYGERVQQRGGRHTRS